MYLVGPRCGADLEGHEPSRPSNWLTVSQVIGPSAPGADPPHLYLHFHFVLKWLAWTKPKLFSQPILVSPRQHIFSAAEIDNFRVIPVLSPYLRDVVRNPIVSRLRGDSLR